MLRPHKTIVAASFLVALGASILSAKVDTDELIEFGTEMAVKGSWREARYRWEAAYRQLPDDPRVLNNLAVSEEALGDSEAAKSHYRRALELAPGDDRIVENALRASRFWEKERKPQTPHGAFPPGSAGAAPAKKRRGALEVPVRIPIPARLDLADRTSVLVASYLVDDGEMLDANREMVRFLRSEFRKHTGLVVLDVTPPPAVPEQTIEDMAANSQFWSHLGREYQADLVVSGALHYERSDASGYQDVDLVDDRTGHKVKRTRFVEQERFEFRVDVLFFDGAEGRLLFRDRFRREAIFRGQANDPISAFHELSSSIAGDVLSVVTSRPQTEIRYVFR